MPFQLILDLSCEDGKVLEQAGKFEIEVAVNGDAGVDNPCPSVSGSIKIHADAIDENGGLNKVCIMYI